MCQWALGMGGGKEMSGEWGKDGKVGAALKAHQQERIRKTALPCPHRSCLLTSLHLQLVFLGVRQKDHPLLDSSATDLKEIL